METLKTKTTLSASELRIGNWLHEKWEKETVLGGEVYALSEDAYVKVESISYDHLLKDMLPDSYSVNNSDLSFFQPIPLSPDILLSAGFEVDTKQEHWHYYRKRIVNNGVREKTLSIEYGVPTETFYFRALKGTRMETKIKTVHHLQNLVHSITGEELNIQL